MPNEVACLNPLFILCTDISAASLPVEVQREVSCSSSITVVKLVYRCDTTFSLQIVKKAAKQEQKRKVS